MKGALFGLTLLLTVTLMFSGCASIVKGGSENLSLRSTPDQANYEIIDESGLKISSGKTPAMIPLEKGKGYFQGKTYTVKISKENYVPKIATVDTTLSGWYIGGNLIFGGLIGYLIVDPLTGAMWTLDNNILDIALEGLPIATMPATTITPVLPAPTPKL